MSRGGRLQPNGRRRFIHPVPALYDIALTLASPFVRTVLAVRSRYRPLLQRFNPPIPPNLDRPIWIHACSVGEVNVAIPFARALAARRPDNDILLTVSTVSGYARAREVLPQGVALTWFPFDQRTVVDRFIAAINPRLLMLVETELWPNVLRSAHQNGVPVAVVNGRISDKHFTRYRRAGRLFRPLLQTLALAAMQNDEYARRIVELGADAAVTHATGNLKFDGAASSSATEAVHELRQQLGIAADAPVVVFGSTRPGDEAVARACYDALRSPFPELALILAPRHLERIEDAARPFAGEPVLRRSDVRSGREPNGERIVLLDTMGELAAAYAMAHVAVIGGSFSEDVQGHNPIEPAACGVPVLFGPCMRNFAEAAELLVSAGGARQVTPETLADSLRELLSDSASRNAMGEHARAAVAAQTGATERTIALLEPLLELHPQVSDAD